MNAISPRMPTRSVEAIDAELQEQRRILADLHQLATTFVNRAMYVVVYDGASVQRVGDDPVPPRLRELLIEETRRRAVLELELREASSLRQIEPRHRRE